MLLISVRYKDEDDTTSKKHWVNGLIDENYTTANNIKHWVNRLEPLNETNIEEQIFIIELISLNIVDSIERPILLS